jgi:hypothetical protein
MFSRSRYQIILISSSSEQALSAQVPPGSSSVLRELSQSNTVSTSNMHQANIVAHNVPSFCYFPTRLSRVEHSTSMSSSLTNCNFTANCSLSLFECIVQPIIMCLNCYMLSEQSYFIAKSFENTKISPMCSRVLPCLKYAADEFLS